MRQLLNSNSRFSPSPSPNLSQDSNPEYYEEYASSADVRKIWEEWDVRILILYILFSQLCLHVLGSLRKRKTNMKRIKVNVWLLYLFADLLAAVALGKLSKFDKTEEVNVLRVLWAPIILFYLGGADTVTILSLEKTDMWVRHFVGLFVQGIRTSYIMYLAWTTGTLSVAALVMLFPGIIKYGERVWIMRSKAQVNTKACVQFPDADKEDRISNARPKAGIVLRAYSYFQTLKPHILNYMCIRDDLEGLVADFSKWLDGEPGTQNAFELIEIELEFMHDMIFSKIGTIFTVWGCALRVISFCGLICVFVLLYFEFGLRSIYYFADPDIAISGILILGACFLDVAGVIVQLHSDWGVIWASKHQSKMMNPFFRLQEHLISKHKRWSNSMGQFDLVSVFCQDTPSKDKCSFTTTEVPLCLKELIVKQLYETRKGRYEIESPLALAMTKGEWMPLDECQKEYKWDMGLEFGSSIVIWHIVTEFCCHLSETPKENTPEKEIFTATKSISHYMMHLLSTCPSSLPICNVQNLAFYMEQILGQRRSPSSKNKQNSKKSQFFSSKKEACRFILEENSNPTMDRAQNWPFI